MWTLTIQLLTQNVIEKNEKFIAKKYLLNYKAKILASRWIILARLSRVLAFMIKYWHQNLSEADESSLYFFLSFFEGFECRWWNLLFDEPSLLVQWFLQLAQGFPDS